MRHGHRAVTPKDGRLEPGTAGIFVTGARGQRSEGAGLPEARWFVADAQDEAATEASVAIAAEATGSLDFAVASAGRGGLGPIITTPLEEWNDVLGTNLTGTFLLFKHAGARIAAMSSARRRHNPPTSAVCRAGAARRGARV